MKTEVKLSIIIPAFNLEDSIARAIDSITEQATALNYEIIAIDDCSEDNTPSILRNLAAQFHVLRFFSTDANGGPGIARNLGIQKAKGQYILFLDGDDMLAPKSLQRLNKFMKSDGDLLLFNWAFTDNPKNPQRKDHFLASGERRNLLKSYLGMEMDGSVIYCIIKKGIIVDNKIRFSKGIHEDIFIIFLFYYYAKTRIWFDSIIYLKYNRDGSIINSISPQRINGFLNAWADIRSFMEEKQELKDDFLIAMASGIRGAISVMIHEINRLSTRDKTSKKNHYNRLKIEIQSLDLCRCVKRMPLINITAMDRLSMNFINLFPSAEWDEFEEKAIDNN